MQLYLLHIINLYFYIITLFKFNKCRIIRDENKTSAQKLKENFSKAKLLSCEIETKEHVLSNSLKYSSIEEDSYLALHAMLSK